jgi:hypothetical protein
MKYAVTAMLILGIVISTILAQLEFVVGLTAFTMFAIVAFLGISCMEEK